MLGFNPADAGFLYLLIEKGFNILATGIAVNTRWMLALDGKNVWEWGKFRCTGFALDSIQCLSRMNEK